MTKFRRILARAVVVALVSALAGGCGITEKIFPDRTKEYKNARAGQPLEVPPDLVTTTLGDALPDQTTRLSDYAGEGQGPGEDTLLAGGDNVRFRRDRDLVWLEVYGDADRIWSRVRDFWQENGFLLVRDDPNIGLLETDWTETRLHPPQGVVRSLIGRVWDSLHSAATRDRFRVRIERSGKPHTVELYITHRGIEEVLQDTSEQIQTTKWRTRPSEPDLEAEMARRLMVYLGVGSDQAQSEVDTAEQPAERAELVTESKTKAVLHLHDDFPDAWRSVGIALDRVGFAVEDRNRSAGIYYVKYTDPEAEENKKGFFSKLAFWSDDDSGPKQHRIKVESSDGETRVTVLDTEGRPEYTRTAVRILTLLHEQLR
jgi:outer membrane protein assembly factor BamC